MHTTHLVGVPPQLLLTKKTAIHQVDSDEFVEVEVDDVFVDDVITESRYTPGHESKSLMREAFPIEYSFIPADDKHLQSPGSCVPDQIDAIYGQLNKNCRGITLLNKAMKWQQIAVLFLTV